MNFAKISKKENFGKNLEKRKFRKNENFEERKSIFRKAKFRKIKINQQFENAKIYFENV